MDITEQLAEALRTASDALNNVVCHPSRSHVEPALAAWNAAHEALARYDAQQGQ